jgi:hypothetical protein
LECAVSVSVVQQKQQVRAATRTVRRHAAAEKKRRDAQIKAEQQEARDEAIAPRAQRLPILGRDGEVIRGARLERDGVVFIRRNPIKTMVARGRNKESPLLSKRHSDAADRLLIAWETAGAGVTFGVANYGGRLSSTPQTGTISDGVLRGVNRQIDARREIEAIKTVLGARWGALFSIVIAGIDISAWGEAVGMNGHVAGGFVACCLDMLCDFYDGPARRGQIRMIEIRSRSEREAAD